MALTPLVLAVDDEPGIRLLLRLDLADQGFRVMTAAGPSEALAEIDAYHPDVLLLDVVMPEMNGFELLRKIRTRWDTPAIFLSAKDRESDRREGLAQGAEDYVVKPFNSEDLGERIRTILDRQHGPPSETSLAGN
ncbi:MAG TPA: response regulator [Tepidiformaceae bacterium]|jgi:two-component system OmpR family response regulator|nr:response regulator [Tepidiformaceae bacterium]